MKSIPLQTLVTQIKACRLCEAQLEPNPVLRIQPHCQLLIVGQAPGSKVHKTGIPWNDPSGDRLRLWLQMDKTQFYNDSNIAILPAAFCYPGKGKSGDIPPPKICAKTWHPPLLEHLPKRQLTLLIGLYAQKYYLQERCQSTLTETVKQYKSYLESGFFPLPHPSPRNQLWLKKNPWFDEEVVPALREKVAGIAWTTE